MLATTTVAAHLAACNADTPKLTDASSDMQFPCSEFADLVVAFTPGVGGPSDAGESALGAPDADVVAIDTDASLTVAFIGAGAVIDEVGDDIRLHATSSSDASGVVYASSDGLDYRFLADVGAALDAPLDVDLATASTSASVHLRVVGTAGTISLDAVEALSVVCN